MTKKDLQEQLADLIEVIEAGSKPVGVEPSTYLVWKPLDLIAEAYKDAMPLGLVNEAIKFSAYRDYKSTHWEYNHDLGQDWLRQPTMCVYIAFEMKPNDTLFDAARTLLTVLKSLDALCPIKGFLLKAGYLDGAPDPAIEGRQRRFAFSYPHVHMRQVEQAQTFVKEALLALGVQPALDTAAP